MKFSTISTTSLFILEYTWQFSAHSAMLDLQDSPMFLSNATKPNVFFEIDNSVSMDKEIMTPNYRHACAYDPNASGSLNSDIKCGYKVTNDFARSYGNNKRRYFYYMFNKVYLMELLLTNSTNAPDCKTINQAKDNFANWYNSYAAKAAISDVVTNFKWRTNPNVTASESSLKA